VGYTKIQKVLLKGIPGPGYGLWGLAWAGP